MELIGVVPSVDIMENATPSDITNKPTTNKQILLIIIFNRLDYDINILHFL